MYGSLRLLLQLLAAIEAVIVASRRGDAARTAGGDHFPVSVKCFTPLLSCLPLSFNGLPVEINALIADTHSRRPCYELLYFISLLATEGATICCAAILKHLPSSFPVMIMLYVTVTTGKTKGWCLF
jgi:hypothetical protein